LGCFLANLKGKGGGGGIEEITLLDKTIRVASSGL